MINMLELRKINEIVTVFKKPMIAIEGIIGAGKTTFARTLAHRLRLRAMYEPVDNNPYLASFYIEEARIGAGGEKPNKYAFPMQMELMYQRFAMHKLASWETAVHNEYDGVVIDRSITGDRVFAKLLTLNGSIEDIMWKTYEKTFDILSRDFMPPSYIIFLDVPVDVAFERQQKRNRDQEKSVIGQDFYDYLVELDREYRILMDEISSNAHHWATHTEVVKVDWSKNNDLPFVETTIEKIKMLLFEREN